MRDGQAGSERGRRGQRVGRSEERGQEETRQDDDAEARKAQSLAREGLGIRVQDARHVVQHAHVPRLIVYVPLMFSHPLTERQAIRERKWNVQGTNRGSTDGQHSDRPLAFEQVEQDAHRPAARAGEVGVGGEEKARVVLGGAMQVGLGFEIGDAEFRHA